MNDALHLREARSSPCVLARAHLRSTFLCLCSRHGDVDKDTWEFYPVVGAHALLELMKCQQVSCVSLIVLALAHAPQATPEHRDDAAERNQGQASEAAPGASHPFPRRVCTFPNMPSLQTPCRAHCWVARFKFSSCSLST
jgi:hypothetical protein